ncbi:hypothetical protein EV702DRAFT_1196633 [Suillus placidus]|uniref:Uncharacterized protein n=1 Tax=Suillus placidus TaxID=48579 RepID=A0A9P6ZWH7_9AGAM|nr:hypothetical protein EV702DRAFT_1196633 [Suillus placidus]
MSSPLVSTFPTAVLSPVYCETVLGSPANIFAKLSDVQDDVQVPRVTMPLPSHHNDHNQIIEPIKYNQHSFKESSLGPLSCATQSPIPKGLPPVTRHMGESSYCSRKNLLRRNEADLDLIDLQKSKDIFKSSMKNIPDTTVYTAVVAKRADVESKCLRALAAAWERESTEKHPLLLQNILKDCAEQYVESMAEASFFERLLVKRTMQQLEDDADFTLAAYSHDFTAHQIADLQLDYLEEIGAEWKLSTEDDDSEDAEDRLKAYVDSIVAELEVETVKDSRR